MLSVKYDLVIDPVSPDYVFYSCFSFNIYKYPNAVKIYFTGENDVPDFNLADYALGFHYIDFGDRYLRFPLYLLDHYSWNDLDTLSSKSVSSDLVNRNFVTSFILIKRMQILSEISSFLNFQNIKKSILVDDYIII